jgi:hypothetical protein
MKEKKTLEERALAFWATVGIEHAHGGQYERPVVAAIERITGKTLEWGRQIPRFEKIHAANAHIKGLEKLVLSLKDDVEHKACRISVLEATNKSLHKRIPDPLLELVIKP